MSIIGKIMGIAEKNNAQLYWHNGLTPTQRALLFHLELIMDCIMAPQSLYDYVTVDSSHS